MKRILILAAIVVATGCSVSAQDLAADWQGTLRTGRGELRLVLHITKDPDGTLKATLDSVDQGANGIPVSAISLKGYQLNLSVDAVHGTYEGKLSSDGKTIAGTWSQGQALPLDFELSSAPLKTEHSSPSHPILTAPGWARWRRVRSNYVSCSTSLTPKMA